MTTYTLNLVNLQIILHFLRFILLIPSAIMFFTTGWGSWWYTYDIAALAMFLWTCLNDLYMFTWDAYTYGSFLATMISQIATSLSVVASTILLLVDGHPWSPIDGLRWSSFLIILIILVVVNATILILHVYLWMKGSWSCNRGVKDMRGPSKPESRVSMFGWKRPDRERRRFGGLLPRLFSNAIFRRIEGVERSAIAATRNIFALFLLAILVLQSVVLFRSVLSEQFSNRVTLQPWNLTVPYITHEVEPDQYWTPHVMFGTFTDASTDDIIKTAPPICIPAEGVQNMEFCGPFDLTQPQPSVVDIVLALLSTDNSEVALTPGRIGVGFDSVSEFPSAYLMPGYHLFGFVEITEWKYIQMSFLEALGFSPAYSLEYGTSINWAKWTQLNNASLARATLQNSQDQMLRVVLEYRTHTFLNALTSIGGLLAIFQGLHLLFFGRPLFWGLFGSKLLDPFGIFGRLSNSLRDNIRRKYISNELDLRSFLNDFVIEMGPLDPDDDKVIVVDDEGAFSERDETKGNECEAAIKSPPKGSTRVTRTTLVKLEDSPKAKLRQRQNKPDSKKPKNSELPQEWLDGGTWREKVIPTLIRWAGVQADPWNIPDTKIVEALHIICGAYYGELPKSTITPTTTPFRLGNQRLCDGWRSTFPSSAQVILHAFFDSQEKYRDSDLERQEFARHSLDKLRFVYKHAEGNDKKKFRGSFLGPLLIQIFATHFNVISGSKWILGLYTKDSPPKPRAALALAAAAGEHILTLWATGTLTIEMVRAAKESGKSIKLPAMVNPQTGKPSTRATAFSELSWGDTTRNYLVSINANVDNAKMEKIMDAAKEFSKASNSHYESTA